MSAVAVTATPLAPAAASDLGDGGLRVVGLMRGLSVDPNTGNVALSPLAVDQTHKLGFSSTSSSGIVLYDLETFDVNPVIDQLPLSEIPTGQRPTSKDAFDATLWAIDESNEQVFIRPNSGGCTNPISSLTLAALDYSVDADGRRHLKPKTFTIGCRGNAGDIRALSFDAAAGKLYLSATDPTHEQPIRRAPKQQGFGTQEDAGASLYVMQVDPGDGVRGETDWVVDLRTGGCQRRDELVQWVQRTPDALLTYCYETQPRGPIFNMGLQGYVVKIPLENGKPRRADGEPAFIDPVTGIAIDAEVRRIPSLSGPVTPFADPVTGRALLLTSGRANGNAFWVFDPAAERFVGTVTGGISDEPQDSNAFGFDSGRGRGYLLTAGGILVAPVRRLPLSTGALAQVVTNPQREERFVPTYSSGLKNDKIGVVADVAPCGGCTRLFVPVSEAEPCPKDQRNLDDNKRDRGYCPAWVVLEDHIPDPMAPEPEDPDRATLDIDEEQGITDRVASGRALVTGTQVIVTGGTPRTADQIAPTCRNLGAGPIVEGGRQQAFESFNGGCLAGLVLAAGHRQVASSWADVDVGAGTGASADASGLAVPDEDAATDRDLKRLAACGAETFESTTGESFFGAPACDAAGDALRALSGDDLSRGTEGGTEDEPGTGFPVPASHCFDAGHSPSNTSQPATPDGVRGHAFASSVACDAAQSTAIADASGAALALPDPADPVVSVARTASEATSTLTPDGQVTRAVASAYGVRIGPLSIGEVRSTAASRARGRPGTANASLERLWCAVWFEGVSVEEDCMDATSPEARQLTDATNQALGRVRISVPAALEEETPGGFQAVITKDPDQRGADQAVNDDDSHTVAGMQVTVFNDGSQGRNRYIVQLASVHTEARYGIVLLPRFTSPDFSVEEATTTDAVPRIAGTRATPGSPGRIVVVEETVGGSGGPGRALGRPSAPDSTFRQIVDSPLQAAGAGLRWFWNNPREAALLFLLWSILVTPIYLGTRRRSLNRALVLYATGHEEASP